VKIDCCKKARLDSDNREVSNNNKYDILSNKYNDLQDKCKNRSRDKHLSILLIVINYIFNNNNVHNEMKNIIINTQSVLCK